MLSAIEQIKSDYDYEDAKEIVNHGCESGVCFKHIYYADTVEFFNKYPDEITRYIIDTVGIECITDSFSRNDGDWDCHFNDLVWCFIELVAGEIVDEYESTTCEELNDEPIKLYANYSKDEVASLTKQGFEVVNSELLQDVMFGSTL